MAMAPAVLMAALAAAIPDRETRPALKDVMNELPELASR